MKAAPTLKTVRVGSLSLEIRQYAGGLIGFDFTPPGEMRRKVRVTTLDIAEARAREILGAARGGRVERLSIDELEYAEFLRWKADKRPRAVVKMLADEFLAAKERKGVSAHHLRDVRQALKLFSGVFGDLALPDIRSGEVVKWLDGYGCGARRRNSLLAVVVALCRYARRERAITTELLPIECIDKIKTHTTVKTYTAPEGKALLGVVEPRWLPCVALMAFAGVRPMEAAPQRWMGKPGLRWEHILFDKQTVDIPAKVSKVHRRRFVPIAANLAQWLAPFRQRCGPIAPPQGRIINHTADWSRKAGVKWEPDAWRHTFASCRLALTNDLPSLALEMGSSVAILHEHYINLRHRDEGLAWFSITPPL